MSSVLEAFDLAARHHEGGRRGEAEAICRQILNVEPRHADALYLLGRIEHEKGSYDQAARLLAEAIAAGGPDPAYLRNFGLALEAQGKLEPAIAAYREALRVKPGYALAHDSLAGALCAQGALVEAEAAYREALRYDSDLVAAHNNLGTLLRRQHRLDEAQACFLTALRLKPELVAAHNNLGNTFRDQGELAGAIDSYRRALQLDPLYVPAHFNLANVLRQRGRLQEALAEFGKAVQINPADAEAIANAGGLLNDLGNVEAAIEACQRAIQIDPGLAAAHGNLGVCLQSQGRLDEAIQSYRAAMRICPENPSYHTNLVYAMNFHGGYRPPEVFAEHRAWAARYADPLLAASAPHANDRTPDRRLRVGYVSSHFRLHAVNFFSEPILAAHDHAAVEVFCYSNAAPAECDATTRRLQGYADAWRDIAGRGDEQVCQTVRRDQIDILVDLTGHIAGNRLLVFAHKPAPVQVTYIGYQNTTGMLAMDYRLTDAWADPPGATDCWHTEKLLRLPRTFFCYLPSADAPPVAPLPALAGAAITFGSFNNFAKVTSDVLATWAEILRTVPNSRLVLLAPLTRSLRQSVQDAFEQAGVSAERVELCDRRPRDEYLKLIQRVDIALDAFPFNGHTTTCDCLWQGVPVVALAGEAYASRFGTVAMANLGLQELIAFTRQQYVEVAKRLASDWDALAKLRANLRVMMQESPLLDAQSFTRNLEAAYRQIWADWCAAPARGMTN